VQSVEIGAQILEALAAASGPSTLGELTKTTGMGASKVHRYLVSFAKSGLVRQDPISGRYDLGEMALRVGLAAVSRLNVVQLATEAIVNLNQQRDITTVLTVWSERGPVVVGWYDASEIVVCNLHVGSVFPLLRTATGRVFLSFLPRRSIEAMVRRELRGVVSQLDIGLKTMKDVDDLVARVRRDRLGFTREELLPGLSAVAAPVFDHQGCIVAAVAVLGVRGTVEEVTPGSYGDALRATAADLSRKLGFIDRGPGSSFVEKLESR
jgi:DNA-binding IclR family transcriptional regulator